MNPTYNPLLKRFFEQPTLDVARALLGCRVVYNNNGEIVSGLICETEAYVGEEDLACHAKAGRTRRTAVMYGQAGFAYVYFTYGHHWMLNVVTEMEGFPAAVLIRGVIVETGLSIVAANRANAKRKVWTDGPGKLTKAFGIDGRQNWKDLTRIDSGIWLEAGKPIPDDSVTIGPRVGLYTVPEPWKSKPWRFLITKKTNLEELWDY